MASKRLRRSLLALTTCALLAATTAVASTPSKGTISSSAPTVTWKGELMNGYLGRNALNAGAPCVNSGPAPDCDDFTLTLADSGLLTLTADAPVGSGTAAAQVDLYVKKPDGSTIKFTGDATPDKPLKGTIKNAPKGDYTITYVNNFVGPSNYTASATLGGGAAAPAPAGTPAPSGGGGGGTTSPAPQPFTITVKAPNLSAKKLAKTKKFTVSVTVSKPVSSITGSLLAGTKALAAGKAGKTASKAKLTLKLKGKIKPGSYQLAVEAKDAANAGSRASVVVKVSK